MKRSVVKQIVKECLLEILWELQGQQVPPPATYGNVKQPTQVYKAPVQQVETRTRQASLSPVLESAISEVAGNDAILSEILADTARTTLPAQLSANKEDSVVAKTAGVQYSPSAGIDIEQLMKPGAPAWEDLAFSSPKKK